MRPIAASAQIAVSRPAEIFKAHGQASMIHYLALGRTVLTNTRINSSPSLRWANYRSSLGPTTTNRRGILTCKNVLRSGHLSAAVTIGRSG